MRANRLAFEAMVVVVGSVSVVAAPPTITSFAVNGGGATTASRAAILNNACTDAPTEYMASEDPSFPGAVWQAYSTSPLLLLSRGGGTKTVYFKVRNADGESAPAADTIALVLAGAPLTIWGDNYYGQRSVPAPNAGFVAAAAGAYHVLGLLSDGSIVAWGDNAAGQRNVPAPNGDFAAVAAGYRHGLGLKNDGSIVAWGLNTSGQCTVPAPNSGFVAIGAGYDHSLGLKNDGSVVVWGFDRKGQIILPTPNSGFVAVAAGADHDLGLKADGSIVGWGDNYYGQCNVPSPNTGFVGMAAGVLHSIGLKADGSVVVWGHQDTGAPSLPSPNSDFVAVAAGNFYSLGLKSDGSIVGWGDNSYGQCSVPTPNTGFVAVAAGWASSVAFRDSYCSASGGGEEHISLVQVGAIDQSSGCSSGGYADYRAYATEMIAGNPHAITITNGNPQADDQCGIWVDWNQDGDFADPSEAIALSGSPGPGPYTATITPPADATAGTTRMRIRIGPAGALDPCGVTLKGEVEDYAVNVSFATPAITTFALNNGAATTSAHVVTLNSTCSNAPTEYLVSEDPNFTGAAWWAYASAPLMQLSPGSGTKTLYFKVRNRTGESATLSDSIGVVLTGGPLEAWGQNTSGQCTVPAPNGGFVAATGGITHSLGLKSDGSIAAWGDNTQGQCTVPIPNKDFVAVAAGYRHSLGLKSDGSIAAWGDNTQGQCTVPTPNNNFVAVAGGYRHSLGLKSDGSVVAWGYNTSGQCTVPAPNSGFMAVAAGANHSLGLKADGSIVVWGPNDSSLRTVPLPNSSFVAIAAGAGYSLGLKTDGSIVVWGPNSSGLRTIPAPNSGFVAIAAGVSHCLGLKADSSIVAWGNNSYGQCIIPAPNSGFVALAAGYLHSLAIRNCCLASGGCDEYISRVQVGAIDQASDCSTGGYADYRASSTVMAVGSSYPITVTSGNPQRDDQCGIWVDWNQDGDFSDPGEVIAVNGSPGPGPYAATIVPPADAIRGITRMRVRIARAGPLDPCGTTETGEVEDYTIVETRPAAVTSFAINNDAATTSTRIVTLNNTCLESPTEYMASEDPGFAGASWRPYLTAPLFLLSPGGGSKTVYFRVRNADGESAAATDTITRIEVAGAIVAWGLNDYGQCTVPTPNSGFVSAAGGAYHSLGLKSDGSIVAWGNNYCGQCSVPTPNTGFVALAAGYGHSLGLKADGSVLAWGWGENGQCNVPTANGGFVVLAAGTQHSLGLKADGSILAWGYNSAGQCNVPSPNAGFVALAGGDLHSLGLKVDGSIVAWGDNQSGQCTVPTPNSGFIAVAAGYRHSLGLKADGSVVAWGANDYGQCTVPTPNSGFIAVAADMGYSLALKTDGSVLAWGSNGTGQCTVPGANSSFVAVAAGESHSLGIRKPICPASGGCSEHISRVQVGTIDQSSGCSSGGYADYTAVSTQMVADDPYSITVTNGAPQPDDQCGIWVDWNQDNDFEDPGEAVVVDGSPGTGAYTATVIPPVDLFLGTVRMRIRITRAGVLDPCGSTEYGEVEDYTIVVSPCTPVVTSVAPSSARARVEHLPVAIVGERFVPGATVRLSRGTDTIEADAGSVVVIDAQHLNCRLTIPASAAPGAWDVVVNTCADGAGAGLFTVLATHPCDFNLDGHVSTSDVNLFRPCLAGVENPIPAGCDYEDLDHDDDVDQSDFGILQRCLSGAGIQPDFDCVN